MRFTQQLLDILDHVYDMNPDVLEDTDEIIPGMTLEQFIKLQCKVKLLHELLG